MHASPPKFGLCQLIIVSSFYEPQFDIYLCIPLSSTPSTQANNPSLIEKYLVRQETEICQHMPACTLPTIDWPWSGNAPHPPTWFSTILPFRQPVWLLLRFRCILWGLLCNCLFILTPKKSNICTWPPPPNEPSAGRSAQIAATRRF